MLHGGFPSLLFSLLLIIQGLQKAFVCFLLRRLSVPAFFLEAPKVNKDG